MAWSCSCISLLLGGRKTQKRLLACFPNGILITLILALTVDRLFSKKNKWIKIYWAYIDWKDVGPDLWWIHYTSWSVFSMQGLLSGNDCYALVFLKLERVYDRVCMYVSSEEKSCHQGPRLVPDSLLSLFLTIKPFTRVIARWCYLMCSQGSWRFFSEDTKFLVLYCTLVFWASFVAAEHPKWITSFCFGVVVVVVDVLVFCFLSKDWSNMFGN